MVPNIEPWEARRTSSSCPPVVLGAISCALVASTAVSPRHGVDASCTREFDVRSAFTEAASYRATISGESVKGMRIWKQVPYPTEHDFAAIAMSLLGRQTTLGAEIQGIISAHLSELYE